VKPKKQRQGRRSVRSRAGRKMSEMVWEFAGEFIRMGKTLQDRQNRLTAASSAWNMACSPPEARQRALDKYIESYRSYCPRVTEEELSDIRSDMEKLVASKLSLFPDVQKQIVHAEIFPEAGKDRIAVASMRLE